MLTGLLQRASRELDSQGTARAAAGSTAAGFVLVGAWSLVCPECVVAAGKGVSVDPPLRPMVVPEFVTVSHVRPSPVLQVLASSIEPILKALALNIAGKLWWRRVPSPASVVAAGRRWWWTLRDNHRRNSQRRRKNHSGKTCN